MRSSYKAYRSPFGPQYVFSWIFGDTRACMRHWEAWWRGL